MVELLVKIICFILIPLVLGIQLADEGWSFLEAVVLGIVAISFALALLL